MSAFQLLAEQWGHDCQDGRLYCVQQLPVEPQEGQGEQHIQVWVFKIISVGIPTYAVSRAEVGIETGFHSGVGRNAEGNNL